MRQTVPVQTPAPVIVIGAGPVGLYAAFQLGLRGMRPVLIDALPRAGGQCAALYPDREILDAPGFSTISARELADYRFDDQIIAYAWDRERYRRERYAEINSAQTQSADANWFLLKSSQQDNLFQW